MRLDARPPAEDAGERGVGLMEVVVSVAIATVAVIVLAWSFSAAGAFVNSYEAARIGLAAAQRRMEMLAALPPGSDSLAVPKSFGPFPVMVDDVPVAQESWRVAAFTDPQSGHASGTPDLAKVTVTVRWTWASPQGGDSLRLTRLFPLP